MESAFALIQRRKYHEAVEELLQLVDSPNVDVAATARERLNELQDIERVLKNIWEDSARKRDTDLQSAVNFLQQNVEVAEGWGYTDWRQRLNDYQNILLAAERSFLALPDPATAQQLQSWLINTPAHLGMNRCANDWILPCD